MDDFEQHIDLNSILVGVDGSSASWIAYENSQVFNKLIVLHVTDPFKTYLKYEYLPETIYDTYHTDLLSKFPEKNYQVKLASLEFQQQNLKKKFLEVAENLSPKYIFLGYHGRKGPKGDPTILGQTVRFTVYNSQTPLFIVKNLYKRDQGGLNFLVCINHSQEWQKTLQTTLNLSQDFNDKIYVCFVPTEQTLDELKQLKKSVRNVFAHESVMKIQLKYQFQIQKNLQWQFIMLKKNFFVGEEIVNFVNLNGQIQIDIVAFGTNGMGTIGNISEYILTHAKANLLIVI